MKTYHFTCDVISDSGDKTCKGFDVEAERFTTACRLLLREAQSRGFALFRLYPRYKIVNESGKISFRFLPDNILDRLKVLSDD